MALAVSAGWVAVAGLGLSPATVIAETPAQRVVQGKVLDSGDAPQPGAIVYLKSGKTDVIKSYIAAPDGAYRFGQLSADTDYTLWAELHGKKSPVKTISSFDSKKQFLINLHLSEKSE